MPPAGLEAVFLENRERIVRFLAARGAGDAAEDLAQEVWFKVARRSDGPIANPLAYLYRAADTLMIDRHRARRQAELRDRAWSEAEGRTEPGSAPSPERIVEARLEADRVREALAALGPRREAVFRRVRIDGAPQRRVAEELGISLSTVESDLRAVVRLLTELKERMR